MTGPEQSPREPLRAAVPGDAAKTTESPAASPEAPESTVPKAAERTVPKAAETVAPEGGARPARRAALRAVMRTATGATGRGAVASAWGVRRWTRRPAGRFGVPLLAILAVLAATGASGRWLVPATAPHPGPVPVASASPENTVGPAPTAGLPTIDPTPSGSALPPGTPTRPVDALAGWAGRIAAAVSIPATALAAYGYAQLTAAVTLPACHLSWTTLAGIGKVESNHGSANGSTLQPDGKVLPPIIGAALDGNGVQLVRDTDGGTLDGDRTYDHAVGPMQFLPATWQQYRVDGDADGAQDANDINDAALAAANYLCAGGRDLATSGGWWAAVLSYNNIQAYAQRVFTAANDYGRLSRTVT